MNDPIFQIKVEKENIIEKGTAKILEDDKELRIDNQYYLKNRPVKIDIKKMSDYLISMKESIGKLDKDTIDKVREEIKKKYVIIRNDIIIAKWIKVEYISFVEEDNFEILDSCNEIEFIISMCLIIYQKEIIKRNY